MSSKISVIVEKYLYAVYDIWNAFSDLHIRFHK